VKRRHFIKTATTGTFATMLGTPIVFAHTMPSGYIPLAAQGADPFKQFGKDKQMIVLNDRPWNIEAQAHLLNEPITSNASMFIRNNGLIPQDIDVSNWTISFNGEALSSPKTYSLAALKAKFKHYTYQLTLECGGNGRSEVDPPAKGNQWTGIRLRDILEDIGIKNNAVYIGYHAADTHLSGDPTKEPISRGVPIAKALQDETLLAFQMNGQDIPLAHGHPLRLVAGGWPASASGKWITGISIRDKIHEYYRVHACKILNYLP